MRGVSRLRKFPALAVGRAEEGRFAVLAYDAGGDPHAHDLKKLDAILTDIRHRLGEPEPEDRPLEPGMKSTLDQLEKKWNAQPHKQRDRER